MEENRKRRILIIDDNKTNILTLTRILASDYTIYASKSGVDGIELAHEQAPDLILLDIIMPDIDGYEVLLKLKSDEKTMHIPVIFVTGLDADGDSEKGLKLGAVDYINKPFNPSVVKLSVERQLQKL